ncbi:DedA family protein [Eubacterium multiforme]|uniref:Membrane protein DedA with SNARE-associated domain n=1 Tax=Eubacterium multiforme TaxID=83339 RepID=A0ABT9UXN7_9FIRM|nr:DedA family protein [Eubacterium multiforme]MDQ0151078.1 membrane protein DedA with SNARE-associated domain [Eubacterium multiforme]
MNFLSLIKVFISKYGAISVFFTSMLEYLFVPIPSEVVLPFVGAIYKSNNQNIILVTIIAVLGGSLGSLIMFLLGKYVVIKFVDKLKEKSPKAKVTLEKSERLLYKYRYIGVFLSRIFPLARTVTSIVAGIIGMKLYRFLFFSALGMFLWDFSLIELGTIFTKNSALIDGMVKKYYLIILAILIVILLIFITIKHIKNKKNTSK